MVKKKKLPLYIQDLKLFLFLFFLVVFLSFPFPLGFYVVVLGNLSMVKRIVGYDSGKVGLCLLVFALWSLLFIILKLQKDSFVFVFMKYIEMK